MAMMAMTTKSSIKVNARRGGEARFEDAALGQFQPESPGFDATLPEYALQVFHEIWLCELQSTDVHADFLKLPCFQGVHGLPQNPAADWHDQPRGLGQWDEVQRAHHPGGPEPAQKRLVRHHSATLGIYLRLEVQPQLIPFEGPA